MGLWEESKVYEGEGDTRFYFIGQGCARKEKDGKGW